MYLTASHPVALAHDVSDEVQALGVASVIIRTVVLMGTTMLLLRRWTPPAGTFTALFTVTALALAGLDGFEAIALVPPFVVGGIVADVIVARGLGRPYRNYVIGVGVPLVTWLGYFGVHALAWGVHWPAEIWTGAVAFAALAGLGLAIIANGLTPPVAASDSLPAEGVDDRSEALERTSVR
jgi:hypothetical protein